MEHAGFFELLAPSNSLLTVDLLKQLGQGFGLFLTLNICYKLNYGGIFLGDLYGSRVSVK